jgi:hypothetical protein
LVDNPKLLGKPNVEVVDILKIDMYYCARFQGVDFMWGIDFSTLYLIPTSQKKSIHREIV